MNANLGEAVIHSPLFLDRRLFHLLLDLAEYCIEVEAFGILDNSFSRQALACTTNEVVAVLPTQTEFLGVATGLHHVHNEPVEQFGGANVADHRVELGCGLQTRVARRRAAVSPAAQSSSARSCYVLSRLARERRWVRFTP